MHGVQEHLKAMVNRHDLSGRYPQSAPDFRAEVPVIEFGRSPLDGSHKFLNAILGEGSDSKESSEAYVDPDMNMSTVYSSGDEYSAN